MDAPISTTVDPADYIQIIRGNTVLVITAGALIAPALAASNGAANTIIALTSRIAALEGKPAPVVHFTATLTPGALVVGTKTFTVTVPGVLASDFMAAEPSADLPSGLVVGYVRALSANTVEIALVAGIAVTVASPISLLLVALR